MLVRFLQPENAMSSIAVIPSDKTTLCSPVQFTKAPKRKETLPGTVTLRRLAQPENAESPICSRLSGKTMLRSSVQSSKASGSMLIKPSGRTRLVKSRPENARLLIFVTGIPCTDAGTLTSVALPRYSSIVSVIWPSVSSVANRKSASS